MSKQANAKKDQGYEQVPVLPTCGNCAHFKSDVELPAWMVESKVDWAGRPYTVEEHGREKNLRCGLGGFAVKKLANCQRYEVKQPEAA